MTTRGRVRLVLTAAVAVAAVMALILAVTTALTQAYSLQSPAPVVSTYYSTPVPVDNDSGMGGGGAPDPGHPAIPPIPPLPPETEETQSANAEGKLKGCGEGRLAFRAPHPLRQGETVGFVVRVAFKTSPIDPGGGLPGTGEPTRRDTLLCAKMQADLTSTGMKIERTTSDIISLPESHMGEWGWHITGVQPGRHEMMLRLTVPDPAKGATFVATFSETITVDVGLTYVVSNWLKDMSAPINAFLGSIVIVGGWIAVVFGRKRMGKHAAKSRAD